MKWSYKTMYYDPDDQIPAVGDNPTRADFTRALDQILGPPAIEADLNQLGKDGWELVAVVSGKVSDNGRPWLAILKRPA